jgi:hypothetical protein
LLAVARSLGARLFSSREYEQLETTNAQFVGDLYGSYLGREPDPGGYRSWIRALANGRSRTAVRDGFARSREFRDTAGRLCPQPPDARPVA